MKTSLQTSDSSQSAESTLEFQADIVPTNDDETPVATYRDWIPEQTRVITYSVGSLGFPGIPVTTRELATVHCRKNHGRILEANYLPGRAFLRVMR